MTGRERVTAAIERQPLDRVPRYDGFREDTLMRREQEVLKLPEVKNILVEGEEKSIGRPVDACFYFDLAQLFMDISMQSPPEWWQAGKIIRMRSDGDIRSLVDDIIEGHVRTAGCKEGELMMIP